MDNYNQVWDTGLDWLTFTLTPGNINYVREFDRAHHYLAKALDDGHTIEHTRLRDYTVDKSQHVLVGEREDGLLVQYTSSLANVVGLEIAADGAQIKPTRIDIQSTVKTSELRPDWARDLMRQVLDETRGNKVSKRSKINLYHQEKKNLGIIVGAESSDLRSRHYDKFLEQKGKTERGLFRHEVQLRRKYAVNAWDHFTAADDKMAFTNGVVKARAQSLGIIEPALDNIELHRLPSTYDPSDWDRWFDWVEKSVAPKIRRAMDENLTLEFVKRLNLSYYQLGDLNDAAFDRRQEHEITQQAR